MSERPTVIDRIDIPSAGAAQRTAFWLTYVLAEPLTATLVTVYSHGGHQELTSPSLVLSREDLANLGREFTRLSQLEFPS